MTVRVYSCLGQVLLVYYFVGKMIFILSLYHCSQNTDNVKLLTYQLQTQRQRCDKLSSIESDYERSKLENKVSSTAANSHNFTAHIVRNSTDLSRFCPYKSVFHTSAVQTVFFSK